MKLPFAVLCCLVLSIHSGLVESSPLPRLSSEFVEKGAGSMAGEIKNIRHPLGTRPQFEDPVPEMLKKVRPVKITGERSKFTENELKRETPPVSKFQVHGEPHRTQNSRTVLDVESSPPASISKEAASDYLSTKPWGEW